MWDVMVLWSLRSRKKIQIWNPPGNQTSKLLPTGILHSCRGTFREQKLALHSKKEERLRQKEAWIQPYWARMEKEALDLGVLSRMRTYLQIWIRIGKLLGVDRREIHSHWDSQNQVPMRSDFSVSVKQMESLTQEPKSHGLGSLTVFLYLQSDCSAMAQCHEAKNWICWPPPCLNNIQVKICSNPLWLGGHTWFSFYQVV